MSFKITVDCVQTFSSYRSREKSVGPVCQTCITEMTNHNKPIKILSIFIIAAIHTYMQLVSVYTHVCSK